MTTRVLHDNQAGALLRLQRARTLLAEASGLMRACVRENLDQLEPLQQANAIEDAESRLALIMVQIRTTPMGNGVG